MAGVRLPEQNQVLLTGRLTRDPEVFFTPQGTAKCWFSIAVNQAYKDKATGDWKEQVSYIPVVVWRQAAERCKEKLRKGSPVHIDGRLRSREYEDKKSGTKRTVLEVEARRVQFLAQAEGGSQSQEARDEAAQEAAPAGVVNDSEEVPF
ncbi:MAG: single-stranded DNA-binding protein [Elusimicrobia bacterium]|nr:single-stranded DNA-binding protein [Elusimicrobiota bacterium]